jgi:hypothetical protein
MISSEVQRTLVKSPPELWAELSDPDALTRHLGELGEIRITRTVPETTVEWEATTGGAQGKVTLAPSGWGTKVTLTVTREAAELAPPVEPDPAIVDEPSPEPEPLAVAETEPAIEAEEPSIAEEPQPRPGFFARLFRRRKELLQSEPEPEQPAVIEIDEPEQPQDEEALDIAAELKAAEEVASEQVTAMLTAVLDRLGAAHHRPFSRA